ncbi:DUF898 domain-containing protein [Microvirga sp. 17 mud 1-3]|nr:DUF898 domain-containing protein [Microvirga sp. 17 mud 1-3]
MTASLASEHAPPAVGSAPMSFSGRGGEFLRLLVTGSLFQIPTFGFYRFWLLTKLRRHLWSNTQVAGESFEYIGSAKELLIGFLIALAVLTPIYLGYFILGLILEEQQALASLPLVLILYVLAHFGVYRARRYRASRTVFRGVRFWMTGRGWAYAFRAILWDIATVLTLGLALPWASASLERYRMRHTYYGNVQGDFVGTGWTLFKRGIGLWALGLALTIGTPTIFALMPKRAPETASFWGILVPLSVVLVFLALWPIAMAIFARWQLEGVRFGQAAISSDLRIGAFYGIFLKTILSALAFVLCFGLVVCVIGYVFREALIPMLGSFNAILTQGEADASDLGTELANAGIVVAVGMLAYLVLFLGLGVIQRYFMGRGLWAVIVGSLSVSNLETLASAVAAGRPAGVLGEGLADALDFNVGI